MKLYTDCLFFVQNEEAKKIVEANNILYIENKCTKIEFEKYFN